MGANSRVLLVWDRIGDYHAARFRALEAQLGAGNVFLADLGSADGLYGWKNPLNGHPGYGCLSEKKVEEADLLSRFSRFKKQVETQSIDTLGLAGYGRPEYNLMLAYARAKGLRVILFAESWYGDRPVLNFLKGAWLSLTCSGFLVSGERARSHFQKRLHLRNHPVEIGYSAVDNPHFESAGFSAGNPELLCVARFSPEKNLETLIRAFQLSRLSATWTLRLVGGGPMESELRQVAAGHTAVLFSNWLPYPDLPSLYARAGFFILPSRFEPWGLVVNEAMAAGLPIALSNACGCLPDLLKRGNGFSFDPENESDLVEVLNKIADLPQETLQEMGRISRETVADYSCTRWADRFLDLMRQT